MPQRPIPVAVSARVSLVAVAALLGVLLADLTRIGEFALTRSEAVVGVVDRRVLERTCPDGLGLPTLRGLARAQKRPYRCGTVMTDRGNFALLPSGSLLPLGMAREEMVDLLRVGRCYRIGWFGYRDDPARGAPYDPRQTNTIYRVAPLADCPPSIRFPPPPDRPARAGPPDTGTPWEPAPGGLRLHLRVDVVPGASSEAVLGIEKARDRAAVLRLRVAAQPQTGQANEAAMSLLARQLGLPRSALSLVSGGTSRRKTVLIQGDPDDLARRLQALAP